MADAETQPQQSVPANEGAPPPAAASATAAPAAAAAAAASAGAASPQSEEEASSSSPASPQSPSSPENPPAPPPSVATPGPAAEAEAGAPPSEGQGSLSPASLPNVVGSDGGGATPFNMSRKESELLSNQGDTSNSSPGSSMTSPPPAAVPNNTPEAGSASPVERPAVVDIQQQQEPQQQQQKDDALKPQEAAAVAAAPAPAPEPQAAPAAAAADTSVQPAMSKVDYPPGRDPKSRSPPRRDSSSSSNNSPPKVSILGTSLSPTKAAPGAMKIPYNLVRKVCPSVELPHCHPHHLEHSELYPDLRLDDVFWATVAQEIKNHEFPPPDTGITFTAEDVEKWAEEGACPLGFEQAEWDTLRKHFNPELPNGVFDSLGFQRLLRDVGAPCTVAMATHLLMRLRCLESGRIRCETACFAMRAVQRVIARHAVAEDLASQVHVRREVQSALSSSGNRQLLQHGGVSRASDTTGFNTPQETPRSGAARQLPSEAGGGGPSQPSNPPTPRGGGVSAASPPVVPALQLMVHPGVHRPVVTPVSPPHESGQHHGGTGSAAGSSRAGSLTPRNTSPNNNNQPTSSSVASQHQQQQQQQISANNNRRNAPRSEAGTATTGGGAPLTARSEAAQTTMSTARSTFSSRGAPNLGARRSPPRDDRVLITEGESGVMSHSPHRSTLKVMEQRRQREAKQLAELAAAQRLDEMEDERRKKYGMRPRKRSASPGGASSASGRGGSVSPRGSSPQMFSSLSMQQQLQQLGHRGASITSAAAAADSSSQQQQPRSPSYRSPSNATAGTLLSSAGSPPRSASQIQTSMPTGEAHAVLMRARQNRADGTDKFLSAKARNAVMSEAPKVSDTAVLSPDKQKVLWDSNKETPIMQVSRTPQKNSVVAPPGLGVHYPEGSPRYPRPGTSPRRGDEDGGILPASPTQFSRRPKNWR